MEENKTVFNASVAPEQFDWDAFENDGVQKEDRANDEAQYDQTLSKVVENEVVEGTVTAINKREVIVNIGYKSEGVISAPEFRYNPELKVGDKVDVYVESPRTAKASSSFPTRKPAPAKPGIWSMQHMTTMRLSRDTSRPAPKAA